VPIALLEPPASFEEAAATGTGTPRWFSVRARGPASLVALGKSDLDALSIDFPVMANKVLTRLAGLLAARLSTLVDAAFLGESDEHAGSKQ
jgi:CRP-like cAMP-binding protein